MEILRKEKYFEYEKFCEKYAVSFMQSICWARVKTAWKSEVIVSRNDFGEIEGSMLVLIRTLSPGMTIMYCPRGAVLKSENAQVFEDLMKGVKILAKKYGAFMFKTDPPIIEGDERKIAYMMLHHFEHTPYKSEYDTIQRRYNYVLNIEKSEDELLNTFKSKCRYHIRLAQRHEVEVEILGKEGIAQFMEIHTQTGERKGFPVRSKEYIENLVDAFSDKVRVILCRYKGEVVSGMVLSIYANRASYIFGASSENHRNVMPNYLMQWEAIKYAKAQGCTEYDFMAVPVNLDEKSSMYGVYRFKSGFSGEVMRYAGEFDFVFNKPKALVFKSMMRLKRVLHKI